MSEETESVLDVDVNHIDPTATIHDPHVAVARVDVSLNQAQSAG